MKAVVKTRGGEGNVELKDWPEPSPAPDEEFAVPTCTLLKDRGPAESPL